MRLYRLELIHTPSVQPRRDPCAKGDFAKREMINSTRSRFSRREAMPSNLNPTKVLSACLLFSAFCGWFPEVIAQAVSTSSVEHTTLYSFGGPDGAGPLYGVMADKTGALYGTTVSGGAGAGTVFKLIPTESGYSETVLYSFLGGYDGDGPFS